MLTRTPSLIRMTGSAGGVYGAQRAVAVKFIYNGGWSGRWAGFEKRCFFASFVGPNLGPVFGEFVWSFWYSKNDSKIAPKLKSIIQETILFKMRAKMVLPKWLQNVI